VWLDVPRSKHRVDLPLRLPCAAGEEIPPVELGLAGVPLVVDGFTDGREVFLDVERGYSFLSEKGVQREWIGRVYSHSRPPAVMIGRRIVMTSESLSYAAYLRRIMFS